MGNSLSEETKKKISLAHMGKHISEETKRKMHETHKRRKTNQGEKNGQWKGDEVKYGGLHDYIKRYLPKPKICSCCKNEGWIELCNISGLYKRNFNDWEWLCRRCHMKKDGRWFKLATLRIKTSA